MREIIFRGKRTDKREWGYGNYIHLDCHPKCNDYITGQNEPFEWRVDPSTVGQFTGLTDKNGKRIFEGDILRFFTGEGSTLYIVVWEYHRWLVRVCGEPDVNPDDLDEFFCERAEVIGNIHDNPELIGGGGDGN